MDGGLRKLFAEHFPEAQWQSVESWSTGQGTPDAEYCFPGGLQGWIEFKQTAAYAVKIDGSQVAWAERRARVGGRIFLGVRRKALAGVRRVAADELYLYHGTQTRAVYQEGLSMPPLGMWPGGPARWDWARIRELLIG